MKQTKETNLNEISEALNNVANQVAGIYINEDMKQDINTLKAQIEDINLELHDFNKWRRSLEQKIGEVKY